MRFVRVSKVETIQGFPFKKSTLYKWHHCRKYPELFVRFGRSLFIDLEKFWELMESQRLTALADAQC